MKKTIATASLVALLGLQAMPTFAQDTGVTVGVDAGAATSVDTPAVDVNAGANTTVSGSTGTDANANGNSTANGAASAEANTNGMSDNTFGSVMSSINSSAEVDLSEITNEASVTIIALSSLQGNADTESAALDQSLSANADAMSKLRTTISSNASISAKLEAEGYTAEDVVAIKSSADGSVVVYVDDRS